jgi:hypothetical protein
VEGLGGMSHLTSNLIFKELVKKLPEYLRLQWGQFVVQKQLRSPNIHQFAKWVSEQNEIVSQLRENSKMKTTNKNEGYRGTNHTLEIFPDLFQTRPTNTNL